MKIKNALRAISWPDRSMSVRNGLNIAFLILLAIIIGSCKKEILAPKNNLPPSSNVNMGAIAYGDFLREVNVNSLGFLKPKLNYTNPKNKLLSIADGNEFGNLAVYTDSVTRIVHEGDTSYVFRMALTSKRAISFRNLTIHKKDGKASAFIATYTPTREWINARKLGRKIDFKGDMAFTELNLERINLTQALSFDNNATSNGKIMSASGNKKMLKQRICFLYTIYVTTPYPCSYGGHMPWDDICPWNFGGEVPAGEYAAGYTTKVTYFEACEDIITPDAGGDGGGGGGGGTNPNPPGDYDPCDEGGDVPVAMNSNQGNKSLKLSLLPPPPTDCDDGILPPLESPFYTDEEVEEIVTTLSDPITGNGIELYLILKYKGSKLIDLSRYSTPSTLMAGDYTLTPHYDKNNRLLFYSAGRLGLGNFKNGIEYIIRADQLNNFRTNVKYYTSAADLVYMNGIPERGMIQMMSGDRVSALLNLWGEALKSPFYWTYLIDCFLIAPSHPNVRSAVEESIPAGASYTKSTLEIGQQMHRNYKLANVKPGLAIKEYRLPSGRRIDFLDIENATIYELKPNNPRQITAGNKQLQEYRQELQNMPQFSGINWKTVLDLY